MAIRIVLADDHTIFRQGMRMLLERQREVEVVGEADNGLDAVRLVTELRPDLAIFDIGMPTLNGLEAIRRLRADAAPVKVLMLSMYRDKRIVIEALQAGAHGFLTKDCAVDELVSAIRAILQQQRYLCPSISSDLITDYLRVVEETPVSVYTLLTPRERQVLQMIAEGRTTKHIAATLSISQKTVETYRQQLMDKLDLHSVAELTKYAIREGLTSLER